MYHHREKVAQEIFASEQSYLTNLEILRKVFLIF